MACEECNKQPTGRHDQPIAAMRFKEHGLSGSYHGKSADERYYECRHCGQEWLRETGNYGMGWQTSLPE